MSFRPKGRTPRRPFHPRRFEHGAPISKIDTRPLLFVATFLAVFGVLWGASHIKLHAVTVDLPLGWSFAPDPFHPPYVVVEIDGSGLAYVDGEPVSADSLGAAVFAKLPDWPVVLFRPSPDSSYEHVAIAINELRSAGVAADDICFDPLQLGEHRRFDKISYDPGSSGSRAHFFRARTVADVAPTGCEQFYPPVPALS